MFPQVFDRECLHRNPECRIQYSGQQDGLHILSKQTAAGDEIGWDFVNAITMSPISLSAYCYIANARYYNTNKKASFMSRQTFTDWVFSWLANFKIDFRKHTCDVCKSNPKILACDGTKMGMFFNNANFPNFDDPTCKVEITPHHKQTMRQFFAYTGKDTEEIHTNSQAMDDLKYFVAVNTNSFEEWDKKQKHPKTKKKAVGKKAKRGAYKRLALAQRKAAAQQAAPAMRINLMSVIVDPGCRRVMLNFINQTYPQEIIQRLCPIMTILASQCPLTSLLNYRFLDMLYQILEGYLPVIKLHPQMPEVCELLAAASDNTPILADIRTFLKELVHRIHITHSDDREVGGRQDTILEPYNPETQGRAYYFTPHGGRLRDLPTYNMGSTSKKDGGECRKVWDPSMTKRGTTYLFLWFDPLHGHCYGFHVITKSEGRKDPFASAYMYMESGPDEVFYDFSCQLDQYCLNREPKFWRDCRFYIDSFHRFSHTCPYIYDYKRVPALDRGVNSEICEQFNSYIKKIKNTACSMSQSHFMFYLQFFIYRWNVNKNKISRAQQDMAQQMQV